MLAFFIGVVVALIVQFWYPRTTSYLEKDEVGKFILFTLLYSIPLDIIAIIALNYLKVL